MKTHLLSDGRKAQVWVKDLLLESFEQNNQTGLSSEFIDSVVSLDMNSGNIRNFLLALSLVQETASRIKPEPVTDKAALTF